MPERPPISVALDVAGRRPLAKLSVDDLAVGVRPLVADNDQDAIGFPRDMGVVVLRRDGPRPQLRNPLGRHTVNPRAPIFRAQLLIGGDRRVGLAFPGERRRGVEGVFTDRQHAGGHAPSLFTRLSPRQLAHAGGWSSTSRPKAAGLRSRNSRARMSGCQLLESPPSRLPNGLMSAMASPSASSACATIWP